MKETFFYDQIHAFIYEEYPLIASSFQEGLTKEELDALIDQETYVYPKLMKNMTIFIVVDILIGAVVVIIVRYKQKNF